MKVVEENEEEQLSGKEHRRKIGPVQRHGYLEAVIIAITSASAILANTDYNQATICCTAGEEE